MPYFRFGAGGNEALSNRCEENDFFHIFWYFSHLQVLLFQGHRPIIFFFFVLDKALFIFFSQENSSDQARYTCQRRVFNTQKSTKNPFSLVLFSFFEMAFNYSRLND